MLTATISSAPCIPSTCSGAPETPSPRYSFGVTLAPDFPICRTFGSQPESITGRDAPSSAPERVGQLFGDRDVLRAADPTADADDPIGLRQVDALVRGLDRFDERRPQALQLGRRRQLAALAAPGGLRLLVQGRGVDRNTRPAAMCARWRAAARRRFR